jgi:tetratricopeptide (TPR) repeat protein
MTPERIKAITVFLISVIFAVVSVWFVASKVPPKNINTPLSTATNKVAATNDYVDEDNLADLPYYKNAVTAHNSSNYAKAVSLLTAQIKDNPNHAQSYYLLARTYEDNVLPGHQGKLLSEMKQCYISYLNLKPNGMRTRDVKLKLAKYYLSVALRSNKQDDFELAEKLLKTMGNDDPDVKLVLGSLYLAKDKNKEAIDELLKANGLKRGDAITKYNSLGLAYIKLGKFTDASKVLESAVELDQDNDYAYNNLGVAYLKIGKFVKAKECFKIATRINPENSKAKENLKWISTNNEMRRRVKIDQENIKSLQKLK